MSQIRLFTIAFLAQTILFARIIIPLYVFPATTSGACSDPAYTRIGNSVAASKTIVILNPNNGPQTTDPWTIYCYKTCISYLKSKGVKVLGYVHTKIGFPGPLTGFRPIADVKADILYWKNTFSSTLNGIFIDETSTIYLQSFELSKANVLSYYSSLVTYVQSTFKSSIVVLNPGNPFYYELISGKGCNVIGVVYEDTYANWNPAAGCLSLLSTTSQGSFLPGPWCKFVPNWDGVEILKNKIPVPIPACQVAALIYSAPNTSSVASGVISTAASNNVGNIYVTDSPGWSVLASDPLWSTEASLV